MDLLQNAVVYLTTPEIGNAAISGTVNCVGDNNGVTVTLTPGNEQFVTGADGSYSFEGLFPGTYHLTAVKNGWSAGAADVTVAQGESAVQDFYLNNIVTDMMCNETPQAIPDNDPDGGVWSTINVPMESTLAELAVHLEIQHTYLADLVVTLTSPSGTVLTLHNNQGGDGDDINAWYPMDIAPYQSLDGLIGESIQGDWQLHVVDEGHYDVGVLLSWCLVVTYEEIHTSAVGDEMPAVLALDGNYPNPFNPMTVIKFAVPAAGNVQLDVYDVRGVKIRTLVSEAMESGNHEVTWMGRDDSGRSVASGAYFYRLSSGGQNVVGKMLLMK